MMTVLLGQKSKFDFQSSINDSTTGIKVKFDFPSSIDDSITGTMVKFDSPSSNDNSTTGADVKHASPLVRSPATGHTLLIPATIYGKNTLMVVDTAAQMPMVSQSFIDSLGQTLTMSSGGIVIKNAENYSYMQCCLINGLPIKIQKQIYYIDMVVGPITDDCILVLDFLLEHHSVVGVDNSVVTLDGTTVHALMRKGPTMCYNVSRILVAQHITIPPQHRVCVIFTNPVCNEYVTSPRVTN